MGIEGVGGAPKKETENPSYLDLYETKDPASQVPEAREVDQPDGTQSESVSREREEVVEQAEKAAAQAKFEDAVTRLDGCLESLEQQKEQVREANALIDQVETLEAGSREKYEAAYGMRHKVEESLIGRYKQHPWMYRDSANRDATGYWNSLLDQGEFIQEWVQSALAEGATGSEEEVLEKLTTLRTGANALAIEKHATLDRMKTVWYQARSEYESPDGVGWNGKVAGIMADTWREISSGPVPIERARVLISNPEIKGEAADLAYEFMQRFIREDRLGDAVTIAELAQERGLYAQMNHAGFFNLTSDLNGRLRSNPDLSYRVSRVVEAQESRRGRGS